jgi:hypothetical protein
MQKELSTNVSFNYIVFHGFFLIKINCSNNIVNFVGSMLEFWMSDIKEYVFINDAYLNIKNYD